MKCPSCGTEKPGWGRFCNACGIELTPRGAICATCSTPNPPEVDFCGGCGAKLSTRLCLQCGSWNSVERKSCYQCGFQFSEDEVADAAMLAETPEGAVLVQAYASHLFMRIQPESIADLMLAFPADAEDCRRSALLVFHRAEEMLGVPSLEVADGGVVFVLSITADSFVARARQLIKVARSVAQQLQLIDAQRLGGGRIPAQNRCVVYAGNLPPGAEGQRFPLLGELERESAALLQLCATNSVCVSEAVRRTLESRIRVHPVGLVHRLGGSWEGAYRVGTPRERWTVPSLRTSHKVPLTGRERELTHLQRRWQDVHRGLGSRFVTLVSPDGMGGSRLLDDFLARSLSSDVRVHVSRCSELHKRAPFFPIIDMLCQTLEVTPDDDDEAVGQRIVFGCRRAISFERGEVATDEAAVVELCLMLGEALGIEVPVSSVYLDPAGLDPDALRQRMFFAILRLLRGLSRETHRVFVLEDIHLADSATIDLLNYLGATLREDGHLFFLISASASWLNDQPLWGKGWSRHEVMSLSRLTDHDIRGLILSYLGSGVPTVLLEQLTRLSDGAPAKALFFAETWRSLMSEGGVGEESDLAAELEKVIEDDEGPLSAGVVSEDDLWDDPNLIIDEGERTDEAVKDFIPVKASSDVQEFSGGSQEIEARMHEWNDLIQTTAGALWQMRFARLTLESRRLLKVAAIIGPAFTLEELLAMHRGPADAKRLVPDTSLGELQLNGFLERCRGRTEWEVAWKFRSHFLQSLVYEWIPGTEQHSLHRRCARLIENATGGARLRAGYALVAFHSDLGSDADRALRYYVLAARSARRMLALRESERMFIRAMGLLKESGYQGGGPEDINIRLQLGQLLSLLRDPGRAVQHLEQALEFARLRQDRKLECEILIALCDVLDRSGDRQRLLEWSNQAAELANESGNTRLYVRSLKRVGWEHFRNGNIADGRKALEQAVQLALEQANPLLIAEAMDALGAFYYLRGNYGQAVQGFEDLAALLKRMLRPPVPPRRARA